MSNIHFFPGAAPCNLIDKQHLSNDMIQNAFKKVQDSCIEYKNFQNFYVYTDEDPLTINSYQPDDIIIAGSAGGKRAHPFIQFHHIKNPKIIGFEAVNLEEYGKNTWQFIGQNGDAYASPKQHVLVWHDKTINHNSYMIHPEKETILSMKDSIKIGELKAEKGDKNIGYFYLFGEVLISHSKTHESKILKNVLIRCHDDETILIPQDRFEQSTIILDLLIKASYARLNDDLNLLPSGFTAHKKI